MGFLDFIENNEVRALIGTICLIGSLICMWYCIYKYAVCQHKRGNVMIVNNSELNNNDI